MLEQRTLEERTHPDRRPYDRDAIEWIERSSPTQWIDSTHSSRGWAIAGIAALAVGALAVYHFGPDFRRYLKIKGM